MQQPMRVLWRVSGIIACLLVLTLCLFGCENSDSSDSNNPPPDDETPQTPAARDVAFILTTDFSTGSYAVIDLETRVAQTDLGLGRVHSDAIARFFAGRVYVVNRLGVDSMQVVDPAANFTTPAGAELSVGNGSNPQDIAFVSATKAYVSRLASAALLIMNPQTLTVTGSIDLSGLTQAGDSDGVPDLYYMAVHDGLLYLVLQHLDFNSGFPIVKVAPGSIVIIDPATDTVLDVLTLNSTNPITELQFIPALNRLMVGSAGEFGVADGGIEVINPDTATVAPGFLIDEATLGGDVTHFGIVSATKGFAIILDATFRSSLVSFNPTTGARLATVAGPFQAFVPHFAINNRGELYLAVADTTARVPVILVFDVTRDVEITRIFTGALPPQYTVFIHQ